MCCVNCRHRQYPDYMEWNRIRLAQLNDIGISHLLVTDFDDGNVFHCPVCNVGQSRPEHGKETCCRFCGQGMIVWGNSLRLIGKRKHTWPVHSDNRAEFGRYTIELSSWDGKWHALVLGPAVKTNKGIVELAFYSDKNRAAVSKKALAFLYEHTSK